MAGAGGFFKSLEIRIPTAKEAKAISEKNKTDAKERRLIRLLDAVKSNIENSQYSGGCVQVKNGEEDVCEEVMERLRSLGYEKVALSGDDTKHIVFTWG